MISSAITIALGVILAPILVAVIVATIFLIWHIFLSIIEVIIKTFRWVRKIITKKINMNEHNLMNPKEYYYNRFRGQFNEWVKKTDAHNHPSEGIYIPIHNLKSEYLSHIPKEDYMLFHCALACTILIDQVIYTYFKTDYPRFQQLTLYPKIEYGISNMNARPWDIIHSSIGLTTFERFAEFFIKDIKKFLTDNKFKTASWRGVRSAMLNDKHVTSGSRGEIFRKKLEESYWVNNAILHLWNDIKSLNETFWLACFAIVISLIFASFFYHPKMDASTFTKIEDKNTVEDVLNKEVTYYGIPLTIHPSHKYYKFYRYDLEKTKVLDSDSPDSSFWVETDYADISRIEDGKRVVSNRWITLINNNPNAVFKISGKNQKDNCKEIVDNYILEQEFCAEDTPEIVLVVEDMVIEDKPVDWNSNVTLAGTKYNFDTSSKNGDYSIANYYSSTTPSDQFNSRILVFYVPPYSTYASYDGTKVSVKKVADNFAYHMKEDGFTLLSPFSFTDPERPSTDIYVLTAYNLRKGENPSVIFYTVTRQTDLGIFVVVYHKEIENGLNNTSTKQKILEWLNSHTDYLENVNTHFDPSIFLK